MKTKHNSTSSSPKLDVGNTQTTNHQGHIIEFATARYLESISEAIFLLNEENNVEVTPESSNRLNELLDTIIQHIEYRSSVLRETIAANPDCNAFVQWPWRDSNINVTLGKKNKYFGDLQSP